MPSAEICKASEIVVPIISTTLTIVGLVWAIFTYISNQRKEQKVRLESANRTLYQALEFASIELYRFEASHEELVALLWEAGKKLPEKGSAKRFILINYLFQNLTLFEMALRFRIQKVLEEEVFISWIDWMYRVSQAPGFLPLWKDIKSNYVGCLCEMMDLAVQSKGRDEFLQKLRDMPECPISPES